jgi:magnesium-transporting ATPase (P-type)
MLAIIRLVTPKIPRWIIGITMLSVFFLIGMRIVYFSEIAMESQTAFSSQIFSVGPEHSSPTLVMRYAVFALATLMTALTFYYYRQFFLQMNKEDIHYKHLSRWIISMVVPFFLLVIFGMLGTLHVFQQSASPYLFSLFSCIIIFSILFRPKLLNTTFCFTDQLGKSGPESSNAVFSNTSESTISFP